jgi:hypothetical protein
MNDDSVSDTTPDPALIALDGSAIADELEFAPLANLRGSAESSEAKALASNLAERFPRKPGDRKKPYARIKTKEPYENANAAFLAELLAACGDEYRGGWIRCSLDKRKRTGQRVTSRLFEDVRASWVAGGLVLTVKGYPGSLGFGNPGPSHGKMTRYKATPKLLQVCAAHGITPDNVTEHFRLEYEMPSELVQLTSPSRRTPTTPRTTKLRGEVAELNDFFAKRILTHPTIRHIGWVRKFHLGHHPDFRWNKGGRLYSQPPGKKSNYQNVGENTRLEMKIDGESVAEIDIGSSYLTIFYAWNDQQLDPNRDAYQGILGSSEIDRQVAKFWVNASFGNSRLISKWTKDMKADLQERLVKKKSTRPSTFDPKSYPIKLVQEQVLQRHPLLHCWGGKIRGRIRDYGDLMFTESEVIVGSMLILMKEHGVPSMPVHDSLIVPRSKRQLAQDVLRHRFKMETGMIELHPVPKTPS